MEIFITPARDVYKTICTQDITHVLTLLTFEEKDAVKLPTFFNRANYLFLEMADVIDATSLFSPQKEQIRKMLRWANNLPSDAKLLVHCFAGVSRSTAAALAIKVQNDGVDNLVNAINWLVIHRPNACPNPVITKYADELLNANGELFRHAEAVAESRVINCYNSDSTLTWRDLLD